MSTVFLTVLREFSAAFETAKRDSTGETFTRIREGAPSWLATPAVMMEIHQALDSRSPDDWVYASVASIASMLADYEPKDAWRAREYSHKIADGMVDVYNSARLAWLASHPFNADLVDDGCRELGCSEDTSLIDRIGIGQFYALERLVHAVIEACESEADDREFSMDENSEASA